MGSRAFGHVCRLVFYLMAKFEFSRNEEKTIWFKFFNLNFCIHFIKFLQWFRWKTKAYNSTDVGLWWSWSWKCDSGWCHFDFWSWTSGYWQFTSNNQCLQRNRWKSRQPIEPRRGKSICMVNFLFCFVFVFMSHHVYCV